MRRSYPEPPGRGGGRRGPGGSGRVAPGPLPAPHRATQLGPQFPQLLRSGAVPLQHHQDSTHITRNSHTAPRASCRLTQLRCWVVPGRDSSSSASSGSRVPSLHSKVDFNLPAIPPGTVSFLPGARSSLRIGPFSAKTPQSLPGRQEAALQAAGAAGAGSLSAPASGHALRAVPPGASARHLPLRRPAPSVQGLRPLAFPFEAHT